MKDQNVNFHKWKGIWIYKGSLKLVSILNQITLGKKLAYGEI